LAYDVIESLCLLFFEFFLLGVGPEDGARVAVQPEWVVETAADFILCAFRLRHGVGHLEWLTMDVVHSSISYSIYKTNFCQQTLI
jgi:hypothetical protein